MEIRAYQKNIRTSPRKLRLVADAVRNLPPRRALNSLRFMSQRAAVVLAKVFQQAISNAVKNKGLSEQDLVIKQLVIEEGTRLKRWRAVSRGRAHRILKRTSHIKVVLESVEAKPKKEIKLKKKVLGSKKVNSKSQVPNLKQIKNSNK